MPTAACIVLCSALTAQIRVEPDGFSDFLDGERIVVEGVVSSVLGRGDQQQLRLKRCKAKFLPGNISLKGADGPVEIVGLVFLRGNEILVNMTGLKRLPPDDERYAAMAKAVTDAKGWFELARWAYRRAELYEDPKMAQRARDAYLKGVAAERGKAAGDPDALRRLAEKIDSDKRIPKFDHTGLFHEIFRAAASKNLDAEGLERLAEKLREHFSIPKANQVSPLSAEARKRYDAAPVDAFRDADGETRGSMVRYLEVKLRAAAMEKRVANGEFDALSASDLAGQRFPDYPDVARQWFDRWIETQSDSLANLSKKEARVLAERIVGRRKDPKAAGRVISQWLDAQEQKFLDAEKAGKAPSAVARTRLAADYGDLADWLPEGSARAHAVRLLLDAYDIDPASKIVESRLQSLGLTRDSDGRWSEARGSRTARTVEKGMRPEQVRQILGEPDSKARQIVSGAVIHQWAYRAGGGATYVLIEERPGRAMVVSNVFTATE